MASFRAKAILLSGIIVLLLLGGAVWHLSKSLDTTAVWRTAFPSDAKAQLHPEWKDIPFPKRLLFAVEYETATDDRALFAEHLDHIAPAAALLDFLELRHPYCHGEAHDLGAVLAQAGPLTKALDTCGNRCTNGCMHGVISQALSTEESPDALCAQETLTMRYRPGNCAHAVGHALMRHASDNVEHALAGCAKFEDVRMEYYCATGVFMSYEQHWKDDYARGTLVSDEARALPCHTGLKFPAACYRYFLPLFGELSELSSEKLLAYCLSLPDRQRWGCFHGYGARFFDAIVENPQSFHLACNLENEEDRAMCIEGIIEKLSDHDPAIAGQACESLAGTDREICRAAAKEGMYRLNKPTMKYYTAAAENVR